MTKQRLMLSAAAGALLASALAVSLARADTEITTSQSTAVATATAGNVTIDSGVGIGISATTPALTINSNNSVANNGGSISNSGIAGAIGVEIDTSAASLVSPSPGFSNAGTIDVSGAGTGKAGVLITGGNTFFGPVTFSTITAAVTTGSTITTQIVGGSSITVQGDSSSAFYLVQGTTVDGDISLGGSMSMVPSSGSQGSSSVLVNFDGKVNGNIIFDPTSSETSIGADARGVQILGGVHACDATAEAGAGLSCPANSSSVQTSVGGVLNMGTIQVIGVQFPNAKSTNPESGSAFVIGGSIDGGFENYGPATSAANTAAVISANGVSSAPTVLIDPSQATVTGTTTLRGPVIIGPITSVLDPVDPGYSVVNRGTITASPTDGQVSSSAFAIVGSDATTNFTCLSAVAGSCALFDPAHPTIKGGLLNTGTLSATAFTTQQTVGTTGLVSANALYIGAFATVPRIDVLSETVSGASNTPGTISATVQGQGGGSAAAIFIAQNAKVPTIDVGLNATVSATVLTSTIAPTNAIANSAAPFTLISSAISDQSGTLTTINNAGTISAVNSVLSPAPDAVVALSARAIDLVSSNTGGIVINNSGTIRGDVLFGAAGDGDILNVGNVSSVAGGSGPTNPGQVNSQTNSLNTPNNYAVIAASTGTAVAGSVPLTTTNTISFGSGINQQLNVGGFGYVNSVILAATGGVDINVFNNGTLFIANTVSNLGTVAATGSVNADDLHVYSGGKLGLTISQGSNGTNPIVAANGSARIDSGATLGLQFGSFVSSGTTAASVNAPVAQNITLIATPINELFIDQPTLDADNASLAQNIPYLFQPTTTPLSVLHNISGKDQLILTLTPKSPDQLGLTGDAKSLFPSAAAALVNDPTLGAAIASGISNAQTAQNVFSQFAPDVSGGARQVAIMMTDQATGPVAARQRLLRSFSDEPGEMTLWGEEYAANINNKGRVDGDGSLTDYKDHGFGFAVGVDAGSPRNGWYGGALSFYSGDVIETLPRASKTNMQWYMLTGYTDWRGKHVFFDTQLSLAYGNFTGHRTLFICPNGAVSCPAPTLQREADSKRAGLLGAVGATTGVMLNWNGVQIIPHLGMDLMSLREEGYTETGGGDGMDLQVEPYYANSFRTSLGADFKGDISLWGFTLTPEARLGYRYDFINLPVKLRAGFTSTGGTGATGNSFTFVGPDPDSGNLLTGFSLGASTDTWQFGANYDWIHGNNGSVTQVGMLTVLGRI